MAVGLFSIFLYSKTSCCFLCQITYNQFLEKILKFDAQNSWIITTCAISMCKNGSWKSTRCFKEQVDNWCHNKLMWDVLYNIYESNLISLTSFFLFFIFSPKTHNRPFKSSLSIILPFERRCGVGQNGGRRCWSDDFDGNWLSLISASLLVFITWHT